jgi:hypothetical protein
MNKRAVMFSLIFLAFLLILFITASFVLAQENDINGDEGAVGSSSDDAVEKAYSCLNSKVEDQCENLSPEEQAFSLLALGYNSKTQNECVSSLFDKSSDNKCWPSSSCKLRDTALATIALDFVNEDTDKSEEWLLSKTKQANLVWYLQIDSREATTCKVSYKGRDYNIDISQDKKIDSNAGSCLTRSDGDYWLQISSSCLDNNYTISCSNDFISSLLYQKQGSETIFVSAQTHSASADGETKENVNALCFEQAGSCDYEGTLWATFALQRAGHSISKFIPYLTAFADDNSKYLPNSLLNIFTGDEQYFNDLLLEQRSKKYWQATNSPYSKFYDTALAMLSLRDSSTEQGDNSIDYLLSVQQTDGCWESSIRNTAFLLFSIWPKAPSTAGGGGIVDHCSEFGYYCILESDCDDASGDILDNFYCPSLSRKCCSVPAIELSCNQKNGVMCGADDECSGSLVPASDTGRCCIGGRCQEPSENECEDSGYTCSFSCDEDEEEKSIFSNSCSTGLCCGSKPVPEKSLLWLWILIISIILVVLAIIFRNRLKIFFHNLKQKFSKKKEKTDTAAPSSFNRPFIRPFPIMRRPISRPGEKAKVPIKKEDELESTLKKLKEMGK